MRVPLEAILSDAPAPTPLPCSDHARNFTVRGPVTAPSMDVDPFIRHLRDETIPPCDESEASLAQPTYLAPLTALLERLSTDQRSSFLQTWNRLPPHMRQITFHLHSPGWTSADILQLGEVLAEFSDVLSKSSTDLGSFSLLPFEISVPPKSSPVKSRPYRINPPIAKNVDAISDKFLTADLIQHSISLGEPSGCHPDEIR